MKLLLYIKSITDSFFLWKKSSIGLFTLLLVCGVCVSSCMGLGGLGNRVQHCSSYKYNQEKGVWLDATGKQVQCTIVDNNRIFPYFPDKGCDYWREFYNIDPTVKFAEVPIKTGSSATGVGETYCVKQRYISIDNSGQVLLIDEGVFCLREHPTQEKEYMFSSCEGVQKKNPNAKKEN